jgi:hypothetical protein
MKEPPWEAKKNPPVNRRRRRSKRFDETGEKVLSQTHNRRRKNSGVRRFRHLMKKPDFSRRFWITTLSALILILVALVIWDRFFRYPPKTDYLKDPNVYEVEMD